MATAKKTADALCKTHPGVQQRRHEILLALCRGTDLASAWATTPTGNVVACRILDCANKIVEESCQ